MIFENREAAGKLLAKRLGSWSKNPSAVVLGVPRGGLVVAASLAQILDLSLDFVVVRKLGLPSFPEVAFGAVDSDGQAVLNKETIAREGLTADEVSTVLQRERAEARRRLELFRPYPPPLAWPGKTVLLVDDGAATGETIEAAIGFVRRRRPKGIILALPVAAPPTIRRLDSLVEELLVLASPESFRAVGQFYVDFPQVNDDVVFQILSRASHSINR